jgi:hypothetical protein
MGGVGWLIRQMQIKAFDCWYKNAEMNLGGLKIFIITQKMILRRPKRDL